MLDAYEIRARLLPAVVAALPALVMLGLGALASDDLAKLPLIILGAAGTVVAIVVRDRGRASTPVSFLHGVAHQPRSGCVSWARTTRRSLLGATRSSSN